VLQQQCADLLAMHAQNFDTGGASPYQIAYRFMAFVWYPNRCQLAGAQQLCQFNRIAPVRFNPVTSTFGNE
jgi:hypothetical protein